MSIQVLVHCIAGVSRSVSMVLAYFIKEHGMHFEEAYHLVKAKRKIIHPNDGFVRQLKQYSQTLKAQQGNARKDASPRAESLSIEKQRGNSRNLDKTMPDFKSVELAPHRETTPQRADRRGELYERYASAQLKSPVYRPPASYSREAAFHSLQHIPDSPLQARESAMTPKAKPAARELEKYELVRTSTNYFTPGRQTLLSQKPYEGRRYEDYARPDTTPLAQTAPPRPAHPLSAARIRLAPEDESPSKLDLTAGRAKPPEEEFSPSRVEFFASKNSELNEKIELIRRKYAAEREKLFSKFQSPQKADPALERRGASLGEFKGPAAARPFDLEERRFGGRAEALRRTGPLESYGQLYSRKYERIASFALNEEESFSSKVEKALRSSPYGTPQRRETDRLGVYPTQFAYPSSNYPSYYKYGSTYKRYY